MNILFLGDVVAKSGRTAVLSQLQSILDEFQIDFTIANVENAAHGKGITRKIYKEFKAAGIDVMTLGNHAFSQKEIIEDMKDCPDLVRPVNMEPYGVGRPYVIKQCGEIKIAVINILGELYMNMATDNPFHALDMLLKEIQADIIIVDFHAELTSEKNVFFYYFADRVSAVIGTHTHVQTADERIFRGCAYITDAGMCGSYTSVIGRNIQEVTKRMVFKEKTHYTPAEGPAVISGCVIKVDEQTLRAESIKRIQLRPSDEE